MTPTTTERRRAMKIKRTELIKLVETEIERLRAVAFERARVSLEKANKEEEGYLFGTRDAWEELASNILRALNGGRAVRAADVPESLRTYHGHIAVYSRKSVESPEANTAGLETLLTVLRASTDDEVSTHALEKMGFPLGRTLQGKS